MSCAFCGAELKTGSLNKYCSRLCHAKDRLLKSEAKRKRICEHCGTEFVMPWPGSEARAGNVRSGVYCSRKCRWDAVRDKRGEDDKICGFKIGATSAVYVGTCSICKKLFTSRRKRARCSKECELEYAKIYTYQRNKEKAEKDVLKCRECGREFLPEYGDKKRKYCSEACLRRSMRRERKQRERARMRNARVETVNAVEVFSRDKWRCQLCKKKLKRSDRGTIKDGAPELDHIVPLSKGGEHSYRNTQCVCRRCNAEKGSVERGQYRLFG